MRRKLGVLLACVAFLACESKEPRATPQTGTPERDRHDSIIGQSKLPGASAIEGVREVQATSKERAAALDSIQP